MKIQLIKLDRVDSTNNVAIRRIKSGKVQPSLIVANLQKKGRGQHGRRWVSYKGNIFLTTDPMKAANNADCVMTDKWISMSDKINQKKKKKILKPYQVNKKIMQVTNKDSIFMHCLPASRGEEVTNDVIDGNQSAVWLEAFNRIHAQKSIIEWCLK